MKKIILLVIMVLSVTMISSIKVYASDVTPSVTPTQVPERITSLVDVYRNSYSGSISLGTIFQYYNENLSSDQKQIVQYLIGMYNYTYISARGFQYNNVNTEQQFINRLLSFGGKFFLDLNDSGSRLDSYMQQYLSAIISYAGTIELSFSDWIESLRTGADSEEYLYIPFTKDSLNSWTNYYNDPSILGVMNFGSYASDWVSGPYLDLAFTGIPFRSDQSAGIYNDIIINRSPVLYSNTYNTGAPNYYSGQAVISLKDVEYYDSLYILRGSSYQFFRFGTTNTVFSNDTYLYSVLVRKEGNYLDSYYSSDTYKFNAGIFSSGNNMSLSEIIDYAFNIGPINDRYNHLSGFYPLISHVYLVDDLTVLTNKEEIFNVDDLDIYGEDPWIQTPKDDYNWRITLDPLPDLDDNIVDNYGVVVEDPTVPQVVNNTVINNYDIIAPGVVINVPNDWLEGEGNYLDYTNTTALPFFVMVGDIFEALGEIRIFIIAVLILGLAAGVVVKFLL